MKKILIVMALLFPMPAMAGVSCSVPFNLQNGTTADASQVMANYNAIIACLANAAASGNNSDITALNGLITPLTPSEGGTTVFIGGTASGSGNAQVVTGTTPSGFATQQNYTIVYKAIAANTTATTLQVGSAGVATVDKQSSTGPTALTGGEIATNQIIIATWDGSEYQINPVPSVQAGAGLIVSGGNIQISQTHPYYGFDGCVNLQLNATVGSNLLNIAVAAADTGSNPTFAHPVLCPFRDPSITNGDPIWASITTGMSISTNGSGATLGSVNSVPFRLWIVMFYNGGSPALGLYQSVTGGSSPTSISPIDESSVQSPTGISSAATSAGVYYSPNGSSISNSPFRIIGYADYANGLTTAGQYASAPTKMQLFGPGINKPGSRVQEIYATTTSPQAFSAAGFAASALSAQVIPMSAVDIIKIIAAGSLNSASTTGFAGTAIYRGSTAVTKGNFSVVGLDTGSGAQISGATSNEALDAPGSSGTVTYGIAYSGEGGTWNFPATGGATAVSPQAAITLEDISP